jgi:DNA-binding transcriptional LysR family regulator
MARQGPATRLTTRFLVGAAAFDALRKDDIDLAIGRFYEMPDEFDAEILLHENFSVIARRGHPAIPEVLDLACYLELDHLLVSFSGRLTGLADEVLARQGLKRRVLTSVPMFLTAFAAVAASDLIATVPERLARRFGPVFDLQVLAPPVTLDSFPITSMRHVSTRSDLGLDWLMDAVRTCCSLV